MGNPLNDGHGNTTSIKIKGDIPPAFLEALNAAKKTTPHVAETKYTFKKEQTPTPGNCKGLEHIFGLSAEKEAEYKAKREEQKVGERRHPDCKWTNLPLKEIDWESRRNMGLGDHPFAKPDAVIPRSFRFSVESNLNSQFQYYVQNLEMDWINKQIKMTLYENSDFDVDAILWEYSSEKCNTPLTVFMYDGCGCRIMAYRFHGVALHTYSTPLDYASSDILSSKAVFSFKSVDKIKKPAKSPTLRLWDNLNPTPQTTK